MRMGLPSFSCRWIQYLLLVLLLNISGSNAISSQTNDEVTPDVQNLYAQAKAAQQRGDNVTAFGCGVQQPGDALL
jgi:hypothetical protein